MNHRLRQILTLVIFFAATLGCTEHVTEEKRVAIGNRLASTPDVVRGLTWTRQFTIDNPVSGETYSWQAIYANKEPVGSFDISSTGEFQYASALADSNKTFGFRVVLNDGEGIVDNVDFAIRVVSDSPLLFQISRTHSTYQGINEFISIRKVSGSRALGRFDCSVIFDSAALHLISVDKGSGISAAGCNWDRVEYSLSELPGVASDSLVILNLSAIADDPTIGTVPACLSLENGAEIFRLKIAVDTSRVYECYFLPIRFIWTGCRQNAAYSLSGDTVYAPAKVFDYSWGGDLGNATSELTGSDCDSGYSYSLGGECDKFLQDCAPLTEIRNVVFWNGGVDITCADSIDLPGLCPWNFILCPEESDFCVEWNKYGWIRDYLLEGDTAISGISHGCLRDLDLNWDRQPLTIADMTYIVRITEYMALQPEDMRPYHSSVRFGIDNDTLWLDSPVYVDGVCLALVTDTATAAINLTQFVISQRYRNGELHVVLEPIVHDDPPFLAAGKHPLLYIPDSFAISHIEVSDYDGNLLMARYNKK